MRNLESKLQQSCVKWFGYQYPNHTIFSIPNGGNRDAITGAILKKEGAKAGAADLFLMCAMQGYNGFFIEMKVKIGTQSLSQKEFQKQCEANNYKYVICRNLDEFIIEINNYIHV
jgi:hypothetical protein